MLSRASRTVLRQQASLRHFTQTSPRRLLSTAPPAQKSRSWKSSAARWGLAIGGIYWYNTSTAFAEAPHAAALGLLPETESENELLPTIDEIATKRRQEREAARQARTPPTESAPTATGLQMSPLESAAPSTASLESGSPAEVAVGSPDELEEEAEQQGAFNEETGEINFDCPCLGGMAHGPCGPEFREAFSCFVYSKEEPKGVDCIDKFKGMQECFRAHPDVYGAELSDEDDDDDEEGGEMSIQAPVSREPATPSENNTHGEKLAHTRPEDPTDKKKAAEQTKTAKTATAQVARDHEATSESEHLIPKAAFDATERPVDEQNKVDDKKGGW